MEFFHSLHYVKNVLPFLPPFPTAALTQTLARAQRHEKPAMCCAWKADGSGTPTNLNPQPETRNSKPETRDPKP